MKHKNLQKEIQPQVPTIKPPKKKDPEGLGKTIPIENIGAIATNIGAAALTGRAAAAGEALVMGGTAGLMGAGESILGASIGSGVAAGASTSSNRLWAYTGENFISPSASKNLSPA